MTQTLPQPAPETKHAISGPWYTSHTLQSLAVSAVTGLPALVSSINAVPGMVLPTWLRDALAVVSLAAMWLAPLFARSAGVTAAAMVAERAALPPEPPAP